MKYTFAQFSNALKQRDLTKGHLDISAGDGHLGDMSYCVLH